MNEEEKKAYNYLEKYINWETLGERNLEGDIHTILNLIDKQQEKILELKEKLEKERALNVEALNTLKECIHKDRIRKLLGE